MSTYQKFVLFSCPFILLETTMLLVIQANYMNNKKDGSFRTSNGSVYS